MYAIVEIKGKQYKVETNQRIFVDRLADKLDSKVEFTNVMLFSENGKVATGEPVIPDSCVTAKVLEHVKADKLIVFKKNRRKGYRVKRGHRQPLTRILIENIKSSADNTPIS